MHRIVRYADQDLTTKLHERKMQELRHERKTEGQRLDGLKKALQTRLSASSAQSGEGRAA